MAARRKSGENVKLYTTGDVARFLGVPISTQKEWERSGFLPSNCEPGRRRKYNAEDIKRIIQVRELTGRYRFRERVLAAIDRGEALPSHVPVALGGTAFSADAAMDDKERLLDLAAKNAALFADQRRLVKELEATEARYRMLVEASPDIILRLDSQGMVTFINSSVRRYGYTEERFIGRFIKDIVEEEMILLDRSVMDRVLRGEAPEVLFDAQMFSADGDPSYFAVMAVTVFDGGKTSGVLAFARDISKRKKAEADLKRYKLLFDRAQDIALFVGLDGRIFDANHAAVLAYDYSKEELLAMTVFDLRACDDLSIPARMAESDAKGLVFETQQKRKDGTVFPVEISSIGTTIDGERVLLSTIRDVTQRKKAEETLRDSELLFRTVFEESPVGIGLTTLEGKIIAANATLSRMLGYSVTEIIDLGVEGITVAEDYEEEQRQFKMLLAGDIERFRIEKRYIRKDGKTIDVSVSVSLAANRGREDGLAIAIIEELNGRTHV